jgi:alpha,alpha-trehalase
MMLFYLLPASELAALLERLGYHYDDELIPRNIDYYEPRTAYGSTLSRVVHAWVHARRNRHQSWQLFLQALYSDTNDIQDGTTKEGIHLGAMAGTIDILHRCYPGMELRDDGLHLHPVLPAELGSLGFSVRYRGHLVHLEFTTETVRVEVDLAEGEAITVDISGTRALVRPGETFELKVGSVADGPLP